MINVTNGSCTGCRVCEQICPAHCIEMSCDEEGFDIPVVDLDKCIGCELCEKRCPQNLNLNENDFEQKVYAYRYIGNRDVLMRSASGGAFAAFALAVLKCGGVVFGVAYDEHMAARHIEICEIDELWMLQSSKYVQADTGNTYLKVKEELNKGKSVLYSGTPCQIAGLKSYLNKDYNMLYTVEVVCHGVSSPLAFSKYLEWLSGKRGNIVSYDFRSKNVAGWGNILEYKTDKRTFSSSSSSDPYIKCFYAGYNYREVCYSCKYAQRKRIADLTICDYWGIQKQHPEFYSAQGVSGVIVNSEKGMRLFESIRDVSEILESSYDMLAEANNNLKRPSRRPDIRNSICEGVTTMTAAEYVNKRLLPMVTKKDILIGMIPFKFKYFFKRKKREF